MTRAMLIPQNIGVVFLPVLINGVLTPKILMDYGPNWKDSRAEYKKKKKAQLRLQRVFKNYNKAYIEMEKAFLKNTEIYAKVLKTIENPESTQILNKSFENVRESIIAHHEALEELNAVQTDLIKIDDAYILSTIKRLNRTHKVRLTQIQDAFGIYATTFWRWLKSEKS